MDRKKEIKIPSIFEGTAEEIKFRKKVYEKLMTGSYTSYLDVCREFDNDSQKKYPADYPFYNKYLKKAFSEVIKFLKQHVDENCIEYFKESEVPKQYWKDISPDDRIHYYRYIGEDRHVFDYMIQNAEHHRIKKFFQFVECTSGLIPESWLEYFLGKEKIFKTVKEKTEEQLIVVNSTAYDGLQKNIDLLPELYECIVQKQVVTLSYHPSFHNDAELIITMSPHYLKEYNNRWHLLGVSHDSGQMKGRQWIDIALDRIVRKDKQETIIIKDKENYIKPADLGVYPRYFDERVGLSSNFPKSTDQETEKQEVNIQTVEIKVYNPYIFGLLKTKPIHKSHEVVKDWEESLSYGILSYKLRPNREFIAAVLHFGPDLEIISPKWVRKWAVDRVQMMAKRYPME